MDHLSERRSPQQGADSDATADASATARSGTRPTTVGELRASPWAQVAGRSIKEEMRANLVRRLREGEPIFHGIVGYEDSVVPQVVGAILSRHNFILLGLRGQAKTRMMRQLTDLLDPEIPVLEGTELNDDPLAPVSLEGRTLLAERGDDAPVRWLPREERYIEKLATPDVTVADIVGDIDPIKASRLGTRLGDERSVHYGLLPRANRGIFAINELPDLSGKVQVALFNVMQEGDVQIRGYPVRLPLDVLLVFSANPEDYTARGKIITPLKDRIGSEIRTHYPATVEEGMAVTRQEAWTRRDPSTLIPSWVAEAVERVAFLARDDARVDKHSGVSQRLPISLLESVVSNAERRALTLGEERPVARISDLYRSLPAITGKLELEYEGELKGGEAVARELVRQAIGQTFASHSAKVDESEIVAWFEEENALRLPETLPTGRLLEPLAEVPGLLAAADVLAADAASGEESAVGARAETPSGLTPDLRAAAAEFVLEGLHARRQVGRSEERGFMAAESDAREVAGARRRWN